jgi:hypothetical protein
MERLRDNKNSCEDAPKGSGAWSKKLVVDQLVKIASIADDCWDAPEMRSMEDQQDCCLEVLAMIKTG